MILLGVIPRALNHIFHTLSPEEDSYELKASFIELYQEEFNDLLKTPVTGLPEKLDWSSQESARRRSANRANIQSELIVRKFHMLICSLQSVKIQMVILKSSVSRSNQSQASMTLWSKNRFRVISNKNAES